MLTQALTIQTRIGPKLVAVAESHGPFSIHRTPSNVSWTISHSATGYAVASGIGHIETAVALAKALEPIADWSFTKALDCQAWSLYRKDRIKSVIRGFMRDDTLGRFTKNSPMTSDGEE